MQRVKCVKVGGKLRIVSTNSNKEGFVAFPRDLRVEGKIYEVDDLQWMGNYWKAIGEIRAYRRPAAKKKKVVLPVIKTWDAQVSWDYKFDYDLLTPIINIIKDSGKLVSTHISWDDQRIVHFSYRASAESRRDKFLEIRDLIENERGIIKTYENGNVGRIQYYYNV